MNKIIFDAHQDVLSHVKNVKEDSAKFQTGFEELIRSPIKLVTTSVFLNPEEVANLGNLEKIKLAEDQIKEYLDIISSNEKLMLVKSKKDLDILTNSDMTGILIHIEGIDFVDEENIDALDKLYELGLRSAGLVWGQKNSLASDCKSDGGLTELGRKFLIKANELGIIVDLAHTNEETFRDVLLISQKPVMISHGNCFDLCGDDRNFNFRQIKELGEKRGVQGIFFSRKYVGKSESITLEDVLSHFIYVYAISPDSVMIGSDFGGISSGFVEGLECIDDLGELLEKIRDRFGEEVYEKIAYKNYLKFLKKVL
ncbi:MAG: membrane dipeptidase [Parcubacteria group bacterium]|jgi:membrane dipeptidase